MKPSDEKLVNKTGDLERRTATEKADLLATDSFAFPDFLLVFHGDFPTFIFFSV